MLRHPEKRANIKALAAHFHLIEEKGLDNDDPANATDDDDDDCDDDGRNDHDSLGFSQSYGYFR